MKTAMALLAILLSCAASAQQPETVTPALDKTEPGIEAPARARPGDADERFVPSEEISEDLSVSFPADI